MNELILSENDFRGMVDAENGQPVTTSLRVAAYFKKEHGKVLRAVRKLSCSLKFRQANFGESSYINEQGKRQPMFTMTKDGFMFLVMGFTGEAAAAWKEGFIAAFNWMADQLLKRAMDYNHIRTELMLEYRQEKSIASLAGRTLQRWQTKKPVIEGEIQALEHDGQYRLFNA